MNGLRALGINAQNVPQEHSNVRRLWRLKDPDFLVHLDCTYETARRRRPQIPWGPERYEEQRRRLAVARLECDLFLPTDDLSIAQVRERVLAALERRLPCSGDPGGCPGGY